MKPHIKCYRHERTKELWWTCSSGKFCEKTMKKSFDFVSGSGKSQREAWAYWLQAYEEAYVFRLKWGFPIPSLQVFLLS